MQMAEIPPQEPRFSREAMLEKSLKKAQEDLAHEKELRKKGYFRQTRNKREWQKKNSDLQKEVQRLNDALDGLTDEKLSADCDLNQYENMVAQRDRMIQQHEHALNEKNQRIRLLQDENKQLRDNLLQMKQSLEKLTSNCIA